MRRRFLIVCWTAFAAWASDPAWGMGHLYSDRPESYPSVDPFKFSDGELRYVVNMRGLRNSPNQDYTDEQIARLEAAIVRAFDTWNGVLAPLNLRFKRVPICLMGDLGVLTFDYERFIPDQLQSDSVAGAHSIPIFGLFFMSLPIVFDSSELFGDLADEPLLVDRPLGHPYTRYVDADAIDIYTVALHEIGHVLGMAHPSEAYHRDASFNFLALESVRIDARCMQPSEFLCGQHIARRRPLLRTEIHSVMKIPIPWGAHYTDIPPGDRAFVAFALRYLNPAGADEILAEARRLFLETSPLRFANVFEEYEKDLPAREDNDTVEHAQSIGPNTIILGSIAIAENGESELTRDLDVYALDVTDDTVGATWYFDIDHGGGLPGPSWVDARLDLYAADGRLLAENDDTDTPDEGSISTVDPFLTFRFDAPGRYYLAVTSTPPLDELGASGDYELRVGVGGVPEPSGRREVIPALADPSVADCLGTEPVDTSAVPCQGFGILALGALGLGLSLIGRTRRGYGRLRPGDPPRRGPSLVVRP